MQCTSKSSKLFGQIVDGVCALASDVNMDISPDGIRLQAMDSAHVSLCAVLMRSAGFLEFDCKNAAAHTIGVNFANLSRVLKCASADDVVCLSTVDCDGDELHIKLRPQDPSARTSDFTLKLLNIDVDRLAIREMSYECSVSLPTAELTRIVRDLAKIGEGALGGDTIQILIDHDYVEFTVHGTAGSGSVRLGASAGAPDKPQKQAVSVDVQRSCKMSFGVRYLLSFTKAAAGDTVQISMARDAPMRIEYDLAEWGYVRFYLAPKLDE